MPLGWPAAQRGSKPALSCPKRALEQQPEEKSDREALGREKPASPCALTGSSSGAPAAQCF